MTAKEWLEILESELKKLPKAEREGIISYYNEMIADGLECGKDEQEIVNSLGNPFDVASKILQENGIYQKAGEGNQEFYQTPPPRKNGLPVWAMLLIGFFGVVVGIPVVVSLFAAWLAVVISFWVCFIAFVVSAVGCALGAIVAIFMGIVGAIQNGWAIVGACILGTGVCSLLSVGFWYLSIGFGKLTVWVKKLITERGKKA